MNEPVRRNSPSGLYMLRMHDRYDREWIDCIGAIGKPWADVIAAWNKETANGTRNTRYEHDTYYDIFPADTRMIYEANAYDEELKGDE